MKTIIIFGATSAIARAIARDSISSDTQFALVGRNPQKLQQTADDLIAGGATAATIHTIDFTNMQTVSVDVENIIKHYSNINLAIFAHSQLPADNTSIVETMQVNAISTMIGMAKIAEHMAVNKQGTIALIGSIAGDRGRQSNYLYGTSKATVDVYASGLRQAYSKKGVHILTIKPGFVESPMTAHLNKSFLWATPEKISPKIIAAIEKNKNIIYVPGFWRYIMLIIRMIPESIFKRLAL